MGLVQVRICELRKTRRTVDYEQGNLQRNRLSAGVAKFPVARHHVCVMGDVGANRAQVNQPTRPNNSVEPTPRNGAAHAARSACRWRAKRGEAVDHEEED